MNRGVNTEAAERHPLALLIRRRCRELGMTMQQLANEAALSRAHLYKLMSGATHDPSIGTLMKLSRVLKLPPVALFRLFMGPDLVVIGKAHHTVVQSKSRQGDVVAFSADVTLPDHAWVLPGERLTKKWSIQNVGSVPWEGRRLDRIDTEFVIGKWVGPQLVPVLHAHMDSMRKSIEIPYTEPGQPVELAMDFIAPMENCSSAALWRMRDADGHFSFPPQFILQVIVTVVET
jgi:transcriptional regulator with XRE-family HTH domain